MSLSDGVMTESHTEHHLPYGLERSAVDAFDVVGVSVPSRIKAAGGGVCTFYDVGGGYASSREVDMVISDGAAALGDKSAGETLDSSLTPHYIGDVASILV